MKFDNFRDRATYVAGNAPILVLGIAVSLGAALVLFRPSLPGVPPLAVGILAITLLFGPALFGFFVWIFQTLRKRHMVEVHHVNVETDTLKQYYVSPEVWAEKSVDGANPYPVNGGSAWAVKEFEELEDVDELRVKGVWLSECEDTKLYTKKSHMEAIYGKLTESHIALGILRDSVSELGADIQSKIVNKSSEARERGKIVDKTAVKEVFEDFESHAKSMGPDDLPTLETDDLPDDLGGEFEDDQPEPNDQQ